MAGSGEFSRKGKQNALHAVLGLAFTVTNKALTSNVATLTLSVTHDLQIGDTVNVTGVDATFNGTFVITAVTGTTISYADTAANVGSVASGGTVAFVANYSGFVALVVGSVATITNVALTTNVVTITTSAAHGFAVNQEVFISGLTGGNAVMNGAYVITGVTATTFTYALVNANIASNAASGSAAGGPTDSAIATEYAATGYARQAIAWTVPTAADPPVSSNTALLTFGPFTAGTGSTISYAELTTQSSGAITATQNMLAWWTLGTQKTPANGDTATIAIAGLSLSFASPVG